MIAKMVAYDLIGKLLCYVSVSHATNTTTKHRRQSSFRNGIHRPTTREYCVGWESFSFRLTLYFSLVLSLAFAIISFLVLLDLARAIFVSRCNKKPSCR